MRVSQEAVLLRLLRERRTCCYGGFVLGELGEVKVSPSEPVRRNQRWYKSTSRSHYHRAENRREVAPGRSVTFDSARSAALILIPRAARALTPRAARSLIPRAARRGFDSARSAVFLRRGFDSGGCGL